VESETFRTRTPSTCSIAARTWSPTSSLGTFTVTSRVIVVLPTVRVSTAPTIPPASPMAEAKTPNEPGVFGVSSRITSWVPIEGAEAIGIGYGVLYRVSSPEATRRKESFARMVPV